MFSSGRAGRRPGRRRHRRLCGRRRQRRQSPGASAQSACHRSAPAGSGSGRPRQSRAGGPVLRGSPFCQTSASADWGWRQSFRAQRRRPAGAAARAARHCGPAGAHLDGQPGGPADLAGPRARAGPAGRADPARHAAAAGRCDGCCCCGRGLGRRAAHRSPAGWPPAHAAPAAVWPNRRRAGHVRRRPGAALLAPRPGSNRQTGRAASRAAAPRSRSGYGSAGSRPGPPCQTACAPRGCGPR